MIRLGGRVRGVRETVSAFSQIPSLLQQAGQAAMREGLEIFSEIVRKEHMEGPYPAEIQSRSGSFRATFRRGHRDNIFRVRSQGTQIIGTFGSQDKRARILNDGGVIRSSRPGGFLAIRTDFTKTAGGVVRPKYRGPLREIPNTFVRRTGRGATVFERIGRRIVAIAWLAKQVVIRGRRFMEKASTKSQPRIVERFVVRFKQVEDRLNHTLQRIRFR